MANSRRLLKPTEPRINYLAPILCAASRLRFVLDLFSIKRFFRGRENPPPGVGGGRGDGRGRVRRCVVIITLLLESESY